MSTLFDTDTVDSAPSALSEAVREEMFRDALVANQGLSRADFDTVMAQIEMLSDLDKESNRTTYDMAVHFAQIRDLELFRVVGFASFRELLSQKRLFSIGYSRANNLANIGDFVQEIKMLKDGFEEDFYERTNLAPVKIMAKEDGVEFIDEDASFEASKIRNRIDHRPLGKIARLHKTDAIDLAQAYELMARACILEEIDFEKELKEATGANDKELDTLGDRLGDAGLRGPCFLIPAVSSEVTPSVLRSLAERIERGDALPELAREGGIELGKRSVKFVEIQDTVIARI